jgi:hypothetical protein
MARYWIINIYKVFCKDNSIVFCHKRISKEFVNQALVHSSKIIPPDYHQEFFHGICIMTPVNASSFLLIVISLIPQSSSDTKTLIMSMQCFYFYSKSVCVHSVLGLVHLRFFCIIRLCNIS